MERNADKIKRLENELGRYRKKVSDQKKELEKLEKLIGGVFEMHEIKNACDAMVALHYGEEMRDPSGEVLGYRLTLEEFSVAEVNAKWEVSTRKTDGKWETLVMPRGEKNDRKEKEDP